MAALSITAANVQKVTTGSNPTKVARGVAGASITAGQPLYRDTADSGKLKPADTNASAVAATVVGIALHAAASGQPIEYAVDGDVTFGAILTLAETYIAGAGTAGDINPIGDLASGWYANILGIAISTSVLRMKLFNAGVAKA